MTLKTDFLKPDLEAPALQETGLEAPALQETGLKETDSQVIASQETGLTGSQPLASQPLDELNNLRQQLDRINVDILDLLILRYQLIEQVHDLKQTHDWPLQDLQREQDMLAQLDRMAQEYPFRIHILNTFKCLFSNCLSYLQKSSRR